MARSIKQMLRSSSFWAIMDQGIFSGTNFLISFYVAQHLAIPDFGLFASIVLIVYLLMSISNAFIIQPFQVSYCTTENKGAYLIFMVLAFLGSLLILLLSLSFILILISPEYIGEGHFLAAIFFVAAYLFQDFFRKVLLVIDELKLVVWTDILFLMMVLVSCFTMEKGLTLNGVFLIIAFANFGSALPALYSLLKKVSRPAQFSSYWKDHLQQGKWLLSVAVLQWVSSNFFVLVSGIYLGLEALAALRLVQSFFGLLNIALQSVENFFIPKIAALHHIDSKQSMKYLRSISLWAAAWFGVVLLFLFSFAHKIIVLAGGIQYASYDYLVRTMVLLYGLIFLAYPLRIGLRVLILNKVFFTGYLISSLFSLISFHFLLHYAALNGAIIGLMLNQLIMILYWLNQFKKNQLLLCR